LNNSNSSPRPDDAGRRAGLSRLVRRICLLREQGDVAEAGRLQQNDLAAAVGEIRRTQGADAWRDDELAELFDAEAKRVTEALLTAEIMVKRLAELWSPLPVAVRSAPAYAGATLPTDKPARPAGSPVISDLLDAMLAAERPSTRLVPALNR
jgi:hypothetical protein